nr:MAG TPA: hypothetical protein [Caudoviricetes sp.]
MLIAPSSADELGSYFFIYYRNIIAQNIHIFHNFAATKDHTNGI